MPLPKSNIVHMLGGQGCLAWQGLCCIKASVAGCSSRGSADGAWFRQLKSQRALQCTSGQPIPTQEAGAHKASDEQILGLGFQGLGSRV